MTIIETIILGVVSGSITSLLLFLFAKVLQDSFLPWFQSIRYKGIDVSGAWHSIPENMNQAIEMEIKQSAYKLSGVATFITKIENSPFNPRYNCNHHYENVRTFSIIGDINDRFISLSLKNVDPKRLGITSMVLEVCGDGRKIQGAISFYSPSSDTIMCRDLYFYRDPDQARHANEKPIDSEYMESLYDNDHDLEEYDEDLEHLDENEEATTN